MTRFAHAAALTLVLLLPAPARAEKVDDVQKKIAEKVSRYESLCFRMKTTAEYGIGASKTTSTADQSCEYMRKGKKVLSRIESKTRSITHIGQQETKIDGSMLTIYDGQYLYSLAENMGNKIATKQEAPPEGQFNPFDPAAYFKTMNKGFRVKMLPDEKIDGKDAWVMEFARKPEKQDDKADKSKKATRARFVYSYDKETGVTLKSLSYNDEGKLESTTTTADVKVNKKLDPKRFTFTPPKDVPFLDRTKTAANK